MNSVYETPASVLRPREKLVLRGAAALSDGELYQLLLGYGSRDRPVERLARDCQNLVDARGAGTELSALRRLPGMGLAKAALLVAALELGRRTSAPARLRVSGPEDLVPRLLHWTDRPQEVFLTITLNGAQEVLKMRPITIGLLNRTLIHPREVFAPAIEDRAASIILAHTHPSGTLEPSREDREATSRLSQAGQILGIDVLDHLIVTHHGYYSFREKGDVLRS